MNLIKRPPGINPNHYCTPKLQIYFSAKANNEVFLKQKPLQKCMGYDEDIRLALVLVKGIYFILHPAETPSVTEECYLPDGIYQPLIPFLFIFSSRVVLGA